MSHPMLAQPPPQFIVDDGVLLYHPKRDGRFQYFFTVPSHPLVSIHDPTTVGRIIVYIQDTEKDVMLSQLEFEKNLQVPLGPNASIADLGMLLYLSSMFAVNIFQYPSGLFEMRDNDIIFARDLHGARDANDKLIPENDVVQAWVFDGCVTHASYSQLVSNALS